MSSYFARFFYAVLGADLALIGVALNMIYRGELELKEWALPLEWFVITLAVAGGLTLFLFTIDMDKKKEKV